MTWKTTAEQNAIIEWKGNHLVVNAFAGTGKTSTLVNYAEANPESKMLYLAYNRAVRDEAERKFPYNVECKTSHQLAWARFGRHFRDRLTASLRITDVARKLNTRHWPLARLALSGLNMFLCSADTEPGLIHLPSEDDRHGLDAGKILGAIQILWYEMSRTDSTFPVTHDTYLKLFQLSHPDLSTRWDTILFDEAQDANPVTSAFVLNQPCRVILVGDRYQQIYRFRGADNALNAPQLAQADKLWLTASFRFGPEVARMANILLDRAGEDKQVTGNGGFPLSVIYDRDWKHCFSVQGTAVPAIMMRFFTMSGLSLRLQKGRLFRKNHRCNRYALFFVDCQKSADLMFLPTGSGTPLPRH